MKFNLNKLTLLFCAIIASTLGINAQIVINEYSASNLDNIKDFFNKTEDWVEIYNTNNEALDISGWYISDKEDNMLKWNFPSNTVIAANGFIKVFCSGNDGLFDEEYHTNFKLTQTKGDDILVISNPNKNVVDSLSLNLTLAEHSNCRNVDGGENWMICTEPSLGTSNNNSSKAKCYTAIPTMDLKAGFYEGTQTVTVTNLEENSVLRYTVDGMNPLPDSPVYDGPITISKTTVVKAQAYSNDPDILPGKLDFNTYFIDESFTLPVFSVAADRVTNLANGIGELLPIGSLEYFKDDTLVTRSFGELNRHGQDSWVLPHRSIDWISRDEMGYSKAVDAPIFSTSDRDEYQRFMFRNSGDDNYPAIDDAQHEGSTHVRDEYVQQLAQEGNLKLDLRTVERVVLFLNGEYWGLYGMREKVVDHDYTDYYHDQGKKDVQFLSTWGDTEIEYGGTKALEEWNGLRDFILDNDMGDVNNYTIVKDSMDLISLIDFFTINQAVVASDWLVYNTGWWRGLKQNGAHKKWGYILWDLDATFDYYINYTEIPNTKADASMCDIFSISDAADRFFTGDGYYNDISDCPIILNETSPYPADDYTLQGVIYYSSACCDEWTTECQESYDSFNGGNNNPDFSECPVFVNETSPYPSSNDIAQFVIYNMSSCCDEWTEACQESYDEYISYYGGYNGYGEVDISNCPIIVDETVPDGLNESKISFVIGMNSDCCNEWGFSCERDYQLLGGDQFKEPEDPSLSDIFGNVGKHEKIILKLFKDSPEFKQLFYSRYADLMNTVFNCENMNELLDRMIAVIEPEMPRQIERWGGTLANWQSNVDTLKAFVNERCAFLNDSALECHEEVEGQYTITIMTEPAGVGRIDFNTLKLTSFPWAGDYFGNMDNLAEAKVLDEYKNEYIFSHWETKAGNEISPSDMNSDVSYRLSIADTLIAHYKIFYPQVENAFIVINEFMVSNDVTAQDQDDEFDDWIELYNNSTEDADLSGYFLSDNGQNLVKYQFPDNTILPANDYLIVWADEDVTQEGLHANFKLSKSGETIYLMDKDTVVVDFIAYTDQVTDVSLARKPNGTGDFQTSDATFNRNNDDMVSVNNFNFNNDALTVYPNPASNKVTLQFDNNIKLIKNILVRDMLGRKIVEHQNLNVKQFTLNVANFKPGMYFITTNEIFTSKVIIKKP